MTSTKTSKISALYQCSAASMPLLLPPHFFCTKDNATDKFGSDFNRLRSIQRTGNLETLAQKLPFRSIDDVQDSLGIKKEELQLWSI